MKQLSSLLKISVSCLLLFASLTASGGNPYSISAGAGEAGCGNVCIMKQGFWSSFNNPALLPFSRSLSIGLNYENRFGINELATRTLGIIVPYGKTSLGAVYSHFGYSDFSRDIAGIACGLKLSEKIAAGVQIDYFSEKTPGEYHNYQTVTFETGVLIKASENTSFGLQLFNPVPGSLRKTFLPSALRTGVGTFLNKSLFTGIEVEMNSGSSLILRTGFDYELAKQFRLRGGYCTRNNSFSFGFGFTTKMVTIDTGFVTHEKLGVSSSVSLIFKVL